MPLGPIAALEVALGPDAALVVALGRIPRRCPWLDVINNLMQNHPIHENKEMTFVPK